MVLRAAADGEPARCGSPAGVAARPLGLRPPDGAALRADRVRRRARLLRRGRRARSCARRGRARSRCSSRSCRTTSGRCTCSSDRYGVGTARRGGRTFSGRPVWEDALHFVAPGPPRRQLLHGARRGRRRRAARRARAHRVLAFCAITVAAPVLFFSFVPASGDSALFFDRYMIPVTPAFLTVVIAGCLAIARCARAGCALPCSCCSSPGCWRSSFATTSTTATPCTGSASTRSSHAVARRAARHGAVRLDGDERRAVLVVRLRPPGEHPRPPRRAARAAARARRRRLVRTCAAVPARAAEPRRGDLAVLRGVARGGGRRARVRRARTSTVQQVRGHYFVVRSRSALAAARADRARALAARALEARGAVEPPGRRAADAPTGSCSQRPRTACPTASSAIPDISPHWPPVKTRHQ